MSRTPQEMEIINSYIKEPKWRVMSRRADFTAIGQQFGIDPVVARVIVNRGVTDKKGINMYLRGNAADMHDPELMKDMIIGAELLLSKIKDEKCIRIISDYDVDGVSSNYILLKGLQRVWSHVHNKAVELCDIISYDIPHRIHDGYGINKRLIDAAYADGVDTIITCDNGISAYDQTVYAKALGMTVIITDHHQVPYEENEQGVRSYRIPPADAVIDHQRADCAYPFKGLCGAGVCYKLIQYVYRIAGIDENEVHEFMEILGIATNCDMMDLEDENRVYVRSALNSLKNSKNPGIKALLEQSGRLDKKLTTFDLGFLLGPCINAAGRLGDARTSLEFLLETDETRAKELAAELIEVNNERKNMTESGTRRIVDRLEEATLAGRFGEEATLADKVIVAYIPKVHESVVGIIASRLKEAYSRPILVFTDGIAEGILKGSGRSIESYNMYEELTRFKDLFTSFGGHAMAAGFSIKRENLEILRREVNKSTTLTDEDITPKLMIDVPMPLSYNNIQLTRQLDMLEPYGKGNRRPLFAQANVPVIEALILGKNKNLLKLFLDRGDGSTAVAIYFNPDSFVNNIKQWFGETECDRMLKGQKNNVVIDVAYYPQINEYNNTVSVQLVLEAYSKS